MIQTSENKNIFRMIQDYAAKNFYVDVEDKIPIFICSIGSHFFNVVNKGKFCYSATLDHSPEYSMSTTSNLSIHLCLDFLDTRLHILMRGDKGSGKSILIQLFWSEHNGLLYHQMLLLPAKVSKQCRPKPITEAGMFGFDEDGNITGRPLAQELCCGFGL